MRKSMILMLSAVASFGLVACSQGTQDAAEKTAESAGDDVENAAAGVGAAAEEGAAAVGNAADQAAAATDEMGDKAANAAAGAEADLHNESVSEAKKD